MSKDGKVWRRCTKCKKRGRYTKTQQRHREITHSGPIGRMRPYYCGGRLDKPESTKKKERLKLLTPQEMAAREKAKADKKISEYTETIIRSATLLKKWQGKAAYYAKRSAMTDAEITQDREKRSSYKTRRATSRRGIKLGHHRAQAMIEHEVPTDG